MKSSLASLSLGRSATEALMECAADSMQRCKMYEYS